MLNAPVLSAGVVVAAVPPVDYADPRLVLRGVGGRHHGRSYTLGQARSLGSACIAWEGGQVVLRAGDDAVCVNGVPCREAGLQPGDQVAFAGGQRFVVEAPVAVAAAVPDLAGEDAGAVVDEDRPLPATARRLPLLLVAALLLAAALCALLLL